MDRECENCGCKTESSLLTHCSEECLFTVIRNSKSISDIPAETWDNEEPWI